MINDDGGKSVSLPIATVFQLIRHFNILSSGGGLDMKHISGWPRIGNRLR